MLDDNTLVPFVSETEIQNRDDLCFQLNFN